jgi:glycosyltransferase involved in cell wall biosynthesis
MNEPARHPRISFITTCKGRLHHLKETLPLLMAEAPDEVILVDYDCPQRAGAWTRENFPSVRVVDVRDAPVFSVSRARNLGAAVSTMPWLCFVDADVLVQPGWIGWMRANLRAGRFYIQRKARPDQILPEAIGTFICPRASFTKVEGYDEVFTTWGGEDLDLYDRLTISGLTQSEYPDHFVRSIQHDDALRFAYYEETEKYRAYIVSRYYRDLKRAALGALQVKTELPLRQREAMMAAIRKAFDGWQIGQDHAVRDLTFVLKGEYRLGRKLKLHKRISIAMHVEELDAAPEDRRAAGAVSA